MRSLVFVLAVVVLEQSAVWSEDKSPNKPVDVPLARMGDKFRLIGKLGKPLGEVVTVQGVVVEGPSKGYEDGPNLRVQRVNGQATQQEIQIRLGAYFGEFGRKAKYREAELPKLEFGKTYEFEGYETGGFVGVPEEASKKAGLLIQTTGHYFSVQLVVYKGKKTEQIVWAPADFVDRKALLEGKAVSREKKAYIDGRGWRILTDPAAGWPNDSEGKTVEGFGTVKKADGEYRLEKATTRLVKLEDQRGRSVELRGTAWSLNGHWWFEYRGTRLYVEGMKELPGWKPELHGCSMVITGTLDEDNLPDIDQITIKNEPDKKRYFIVRKAKWKPLDTLLAPERVERE